MQFETKFNFNDTVHCIRYKQKKTTVPCGFCAGSGRITGQNGKTQQCQTCRGEKVTYEFTLAQWYVAETLTIGEIRVKARCEHLVDCHTYFDNYGNQKAIQNNEYMCYETGIGSGSVWAEDKLWATITEAQAACDKLNKKEIL